MYFILISQILPNITVMYKILVIIIIEQVMWIYSCDLCSYYRKYLEDQIKSTLILQTVTSTNGRTVSLKEYHVNIFTV